MGSTFGSDALANAAPLAGRRTAANHGAPIVSRPRLRRPDRDAGGAEAGPRSSRSPRRCCPSQCPLRRRAVPAGFHCGRARPPVRSRCDAPARERRPWGRLGRRRLHPRRLVDDAGAGGRGAAGRAGSLRLGRTRALARPAPVPLRPASPAIAPLRPAAPVPDAAAGADRETAAAGRGALGGWPHRPPGVKPGVGSWSRRPKVRGLRPLRVADAAGCVCGFGPLPRRAGSLRSSGRNPHRPGPCRSCRTRSVGHLAAVFRPRTRADPDSASARSRPAVSSHRARPSTGPWRCRSWSNPSPGRSRWWRSCPTTSMSCARLGRDGLHLSRHGRCNGPRQVLRSDRDASLPFEHLGAKGEVHRDGPATLDPADGTGLLVDLDHAGPLDSNRADLLGDDAFRRDEHPGFLDDLRAPGAAAAGRGRAGRGRAGGGPSGRILRRQRPPTDILLRTAPLDPCRGPFGARDPHPAVLRIVVPAAVMERDLGPGFVGLEVPAHLLVEDPAADRIGLPVGRDITWLPDLAETLYLHVLAERRQRFAELFDADRRDRGCGLRLGGRGDEGA